MSASSPRATLAERLGVDSSLLLQLAGLGVAAFLIRLVPMLLSGGLDGIVDYDDGVYMGSALSLVHGRVVYRDFPMLNPPGIVYALTPFAALSYITSDGNAFAAARVGMMLLGGLNTILVGLVGARAGRTTALAAAALYAVWIVPAWIERSTWLIAPQNTLLLIALLVLTLPRSSMGDQPSTGWRTAAVVGALLGLCGTIQIWGIVPAAVVLVLLLLRAARQPGGWLRPVFAYAAAGIAAVVLVFLPFVLAAGPGMIRTVIFNQLGRHDDRVPVLKRLVAMEGLPDFVLHRPSLHLLPVVVFVVVVIAMAYVAWRRPATRPWAALFGAQAVLLFVTPSFFPHYGGWLAPAAALCIGSIVGEVVGRLSSRPRAVAVALYGVGLAGALVIALRPGLFGLPPPSKELDAGSLAARIVGAPCPTADSPSVLILTGALRTILTNGCPLYISPTGVSYHTDLNLRGAERIRQDQPEYQAALEAYFGGSDAALIYRKPGHLGLTDATWEAIRKRLPVEVRVGQTMILLPAGN